MVLELMSTDPVVLETHGGYGRLYERCYSHISGGIVIEKDARKAAFLARQRRTWRVFEDDCLDVLRCRVTDDVPANLFDIDPYGSPWDVIDLCMQRRSLPSSIWIVVNDGLRQKCQRGGSWNVKCLGSVVERRGANLYPVYLDVCEELLEEKAGQHGMSLTRFSGYYCGKQKQMTHYVACIERRGVG